MHGTILAELHKYVSTRHGEPTWQLLKQNAGVDRAGDYDPLETYPDSEVMALVTTAATMTNTPVPAVLEDFGVFIAPDLLDMYWALIDPAWRTLDVLAGTEETIHKVVRLNHRGAEPPYLHATRTSEDEVLIVYTSPRRLCAVARGIARGIADHYKESITIEDAACMHRGDADCRLVVRKGA
jgi:hypothetical protein